jgi:hypothetical protein
VIAPGTYAVSPELDWSRERVIAERRIRRNLHLDADNRKRRGNLFTRERCGSTVKNGELTPMLVPGT